MDSHSFLSDDVLPPAPTSGSDLPFRVFAESLTNLAWIADPSGWIFWYNQRWFEYTGTTLEQMQGWGWQSIHDPALLPKVVARWQESIATGEPFDMVFPLRGADGIFRSFRTRITPFKDALGRILHWFGTHTDIVREIEAVNALRNSEARFRTATEATSGILWTNNAIGEMIGKQPAWGAFTGQSLEQYQGYGWASAVHPDDAQPTVDAWQICVRDRCLFSYEHRVRRHDGVYRLCSVRALPLLNDQEEVREWVGVHTDITDERETQRTLREALVTLEQQHTMLIRNEKLAATGRLAASIAHEINNPLEAITNLLYLILQGPLDPEQRGYALTLRSELERISHITTHTLRFHRQNTLPAPLDPAALLESVLALYEGRIRNAGVTVQCSLRSTHTVIGLDGDIRQVLANLVGNAIDAMHGINGASVLHLRSRNVVHRRLGHPPQPGICITIADTGSGISASSLSHIFDAFFTTKPDIGTGLGLWVSLEIVQKHEGRLRVRSSTAPSHHGTVFQLFLSQQMLPEANANASSTQKGR
jgi:PAS domain S-box-containing protein